MTPEEYLHLRLLNAKHPGPLNAGGTVALRPDLGALEWADLVALVKLAQEKLQVMPDGYPGPVTVEALRRKYAKPLDVNDIFLGDGAFLAGTGLVQSLIHPSWYGGAFLTAGGKPAGIVVHTTATNPGTGVILAKQRQTPFGTDPDIHVGSWHFTVETDGTVLQNVPLDRTAWHGGSVSARPLPTGWANYTTLGIELVSPNDKGFPEAQVNAAKKLWRTLVRRFGIPRGLAMIPHGGFDPEHRVDPGAEWMGEPPPFAGAMKYAGPVGGHAKAVLDHAYAP